MTKRILTLILTLCLAVVAMTVMAFAEIASGDAWALDDDGTLSFSGSEGMDEWIYTYRAIYCEEVTSVVFYDGIIRIPNNAFDGCSNLSSITIPDTVTGIGDQAFYGCSSLTTVIIPSNVETIGSSAFERCSGLQSLVIENCGLEFNASSQSIDENIIIQAAHTYSGGVCSVCNHTDSDYVIVGSAELHDGYYTEYGTSTVYDDPGVTAPASYAYYSNGVLYLYDFSYTTAGTTAYQATIEPSEGDLTISLSGYNTIGGETYGIHSSVGNITLVSTDTENTGSLTINANSSLLASGFSRGIYCAYDVVIDGVSVTVSSGAQSIYALNNAYIKNGAVYSANNTLDANNDVTISDSTVEVVVSSGDANAIACEDAYITASNVTLSGALSIDESLTMTAATGGSIKIEMSGSSDSSGYPNVSSETTSSLTYTYDDYFQGEYTYLKTTAVTHTHSYTSSVTTKPTCTDDGVRTYTCTCGDTYTEIIPATGHDYEAVVTAPTCTKQGYTTYTCTVCGYTYTVDETEALGHSYNEGVVTLEATCTAAGVKTYTCTACGATYTEEIPATGHSYEAVVTAPTCTEKGYTTYTCSVCGDTYTDNETEALGHSYVAVVTAPTCTEKGYTTYTCSACGDTYVDSETAALGHSYEFQYFTWSADLKTATATFKCKTCGELYTLDATITGEGSLGVSAHIATVTFNGITYTDTQTTGTSLTRVSADYTAVNAAIKKANALNASDYANFEYVTAAIDLVNWNLNILNQETVNAYAELIEAAIANLTPIAEETVTITEPVEDSTTETESEEVEVSEQEAETNPTTGVVVAILPMAAAIAGAIIGKQKL